MEGCMRTLTRLEAGRRLAAGLGALVKESPVVVAISPGGARVASEIAKAFDAPLDVIAVSRLEVPGRAHSTFGAVANGAAIITSRRVLELGLPQSYVTGLADLARREVEQTAAGWRGSAPPLPLGERIVVLVDDGASDAVELAAAAQALRKAGARQVILATPTESKELRAALDECCDHQLLLYEPGEPDCALVCDPDFVQTTRFDVRAMVQRSRRELATATARI
jgi:predicted phosphoribosyltransferase